MKKDVMIDAISAIDQKYIIEYVQYETKLSILKVRKKKKSRNLLICAACLALVVCMLAVSLPLSFIVLGSKPVQEWGSEVIENVLFPLDQEVETPDDPDEPTPPKQSLLQLNWIEWKLTENLFAALGAGTDKSVIDKLQAATGNGLVGESMQDLGDFLARLYEYYKKYEKIIENEVSEDDSTEDSMEETTAGAVLNSVPTVIEENGVKYERSENQDYWTVTKIYSSIDLKENQGIIELPESVRDLPVKFIGEKAAFNNELLQVLQMPQGIIEIKKNAFYGCVNLNSIVFSENLTKIGETAFYQCSIEELILPDSVSRLDDGAFSACVNLRKVKLPTGATTISSRCFEGCENLSEIIIPDTYTRILSYAFHGCVSLQNIDLPEQLQEISYYAFSLCGLVYVEIPDTVTTWGNQAFSDCSELKNVKLPEKLETVPLGMFQNCNKLEYIEIPSSCQTIGGEAFEGCMSLERIELPDGIIEIQACAFYNCTSLKQFEFPKRLKTISYDAFLGCISLESVILPENVEEIGRSAFMGCTSIRELYLPRSLKVLGARAFEDCKSLITLEIPDQIEEFGASVFANCESLQSANLPTFGNIGFGPNGLFSNCVNLSSITFGPGIHDGHISIDMFANTGIEEIVIPEEVGIIEDRLFKDCANLKTVYLSKKTYRISAGAFIGCGQLSHIYYPGTVAEFEYNVFLSASSIEGGVIIVCTDGEIVIE